MSRPYISDVQKMTHHVVAVGVFFGVIYFAPGATQLFGILGSCHDCCKWCSTGEGRNYSGNFRV